MRTGFRRALGGSAVAAAALWVGIKFLSPDPIQPVPMSPAEAAQRAAYMRELLAASEWLGGGVMRLRSRRFWLGPDGQDELWNEAAIPIANVDWFHDALVEARQRPESTKFDPVTVAPIWIEWARTSRWFEAWMAEHGDRTDMRPPYWQGLDLDGYDFQVPEKLNPSSPLHVRLVATSGDVPHVWECSLFDLFELEADSLALCYLSAVYPPDDSLRVGSALNLPRDRVSGRALADLAERIVAGVGCVDVTAREPGASDSCVRDALGSPFLPGSIESDRSPFAADP